MNRWEREKIYVWKWDWNCHLGIGSFISSFDTFEWNVWNRHSRWFNSTSSSLFIWSSSDIIYSSISCSIIRCSIISTRKEFYSCFATMAIITCFRCHALFSSSTIMDWISIENILRWINSRLYIHLRSILSIVQYIYSK